MALGVAGITAFLVLTFVRLLTRSDLSTVFGRLRRRGEVTRRGWVFSGVVTVLILLWAHSAVVRVNEVVGTVLYDRTADLRASSLDLGRPLYLARGDDLDLVETALATLDRSEDWGLVSNPRTPLKLAWMHLLAGHPDAFGVEIERAIRAQPRSAEVHLLHGRELAASRRFAEAVDAYARAVECEPLNPSVHLSLGTLLASTGDLDGAIGVFDRGLENVPESADLHYNSGVAYAMRGDNARAEELFRRTLDLDPGHRRARDNLDGLMAMRGRRW
jgi:tetratricopeptide (TPR) repeat protein